MSETATATAATKKVTNPPGRAAELQVSPFRSRIGSVAEKYALLALTIAIALFFSISPASSAVFPTVPNINVILGSQAVVSLFALAALFPLVSGYFSLGATASSVLSAGLMSRYEAPLWLAVILPLVLGTVIGYINGLLVTKFNMNPFVTTLGMATLLGGSIQWYTGGATIFSGISPVLTNFGSTTILRIPAVVYIVAIVAVASWYILAHTLRAIPVRHRFQPGLSPSGRPACTAQRLVLICHGRIRGRTCRAGSAIPHRQRDS